MNKCVSLSLALAVLCEPCLAQEPPVETTTPSAPTVSPLKLEESTPVILRTKAELSSATANVGNSVPFRVVEDVKVGDLVVIPRGAEAWAIVTAVQRRRRKGQPGTVDVSLQFARLLTGDTAPLRAQQHSKGHSQTTNMALDMTNLAVQTMGLGLPLVPLLLLERGKDAYVPAGTKLVAYINKDVLLDRSVLEHLQPSPTQRTGPATVTISRLTRVPTAYRPSVYCGKVQLARLGGASYFKIQLPPGKYSFRSNDDQAVELNLLEGQEAFLEMQIVTHGFSVRGHLIQVSNSDGEDNMAGLRQLADEKVTKITEENKTELQALP